MPSRPGTRGPSGRGALRRRATLVGTTALLAVLVVTGGVSASRNALPGDTLYGIKRASEAVADALTVGDTARAQRQLDSATLRLEEVQTLVQSNRPYTIDPDLLQSTMLDFDSATGAGSRAVLASQDAGGPAALASLRTWATQQVERLSTIRKALPRSTLADADGTLTLLDRLVARTSALSARSSCKDLLSGAVDDLGPLPATGICTPHAGTAIAGRPTGGGSPGSATARSTVPAGTSPPPSGQVGTGGPSVSPDPVDPTDPDGQVEAPPPTDDEQAAGGDGVATTETAAQPTTAPNGPGVLPVPSLGAPSVLSHGSGISLG